MNKYQEALNWLMEGNDSCGTEWDLLQELVDKEKPMKPTHRDIGHWKNVSHCKRCDETLLIHLNYCGICGQAIDWEEEC